MPLDFPTSPSLGQVYTLDNRSWQWNGSAWKLLATSSINNTPIGNSTANSGSFTTITTSGTITANGAITSQANITSQLYFLGDGSQLTNINLSNVNNGTSNVTVVSSGGNVAVGVAGNSNVAVFGSGQSSIRGNLVPNASNIYSLGTSTLRWSNLWVSGNTITLGNVVFKDNGASNLAVFAADGVTAANVVAANVVAGNVVAVIINSSAVTYNASNITTSGNISNTNNAFSSGPITINNGVTVTVDNNAVWTIV